MKRNAQSSPPPMKPLPDNLPPLPEGYVYLGEAGTFKLKNGETFKGATAIAGEPKWGIAPNAFGDTSGFHYAAPEDSEIASLNAEPERPRIEMEKTYRMRSGQAVVIHTINGPDPEFPVVGSFMEDDGEWWPDAWPADGIGDESNADDLIEVREPREFWVNVYPNGLMTIQESKEEAEERAINGTACILVREVREEGA